MATNKKTGQRCKRRVGRGSRVCWAHGGAAPREREAIPQRLQALAQAALDEIVRILSDGDGDPVRLAAARDILDRAGYSMRHKHEHSGEGGGPVTFTLKLSKTEE